MATAVNENGQQVRELTIPALPIKKIIVGIQGDTRLVTHRFGEKVRREIAQKQGKKAKHKKGAREPKEEFKDAQYRLPTGEHGLPAVAFKSALIRGAKYCGGVMTDVRQNVFVKGYGPEDLVVIEFEGKEPEMREDVVRLPNGAGDLRYRPCYETWGATLEIEYNERVFSPEQVLNFLNTGGACAGVGEYRPEKGGTWGRFRVVGAEMEN